LRHKLKVGIGIPLRHILLNCSYKALRHNSSEKTYDEISGNIVLTDYLECFGFHGSALDLPD